MFLTLLLVTQTIAEWVEISQQHYRKPIHAYNIRFSTDKIEELEETTKSFIYNNRTVSEYNWNKASIMQTSVGSIRRVNFQESVKNSAEAVNIKEDDEEGGDAFNLKPYDSPTQPTIELSDKVKQKGTIQKVPNIGNIKRVKLNESPVKSPKVSVKDHTEIMAKSRYEELPLNSDKEQVDDVFPEIKLNGKRIYVNNLRNQFSTERTHVLTVDQDEPSISKVRFPEVNHNNVHKVNEKKIEIITETADEVNVGAPNFNNELHKQSVKQTYKNYDTNIIREKINDEVRPLNKDLQMEHKNNHNDLLDYNRDTHKKMEKAKVVSFENKINEDNAEHDTYSAQEKENNIKSKGPESKTKVGNMENLLKIMKVVADTISQNTRRSFKGKISYLHELKDTILSNIAERIDATWPDDDVSTRHRHSRSAQASARGHHVQFPSSESALMTISFLTFAVFLVKLVLQIIQTYKNKAMMVAPVLISSGGRTVLAHQGLR